MIVRFEKVAGPPDSLYCNVKVLLEPAVIAIVETLLACPCAGVTALEAETWIWALRSVGDTLLVPVTL